MAYDARQVANWFVERAQRDGKTLSIMSLLKLTYIAHGWNLETQKSPLISNRIEAWQYGPVIPDVYNSFRNQGVSVSSLASNYSPPSEQSTTKLLEEVWGIYGDMPPFRLSDLTHEIGGPWDVASKLAGNYAQIPDELIQKHYEMKRLQASQTTHAR